ncbi:hypothetical protein D3C86_1864950 [compost metagenome]
MIHRQEAAVDARVGALAVGAQTEPFHAIVMVAAAVLEVGVGAVVGIGRRGAGQWIAQRIQDAGAVAGGNEHAVSQALGHGAEAQ